MLTHFELFCEFLKKIFFLQRSFLKIHKKTYFLSIFFRGTICSLMCSEHFAKNRLHLSLEIRSVSLKRWSAIANQINKEYIVKNSKVDCHLNYLFVYSFFRINASYFSFCKYSSHRPTGLQHRPCETPIWQKCVFLCDFFSVFGSRIILIHNDDSLVTKSYLSYLSSRLSCYMSHVLYLQNDHEWLKN